MIRGRRRRACIRVVGAALALLGVLLWVIAAVAPAAAGEDVTIDHMIDRSIGVIAGGGAIVGGIALLVVAT